MGKRLTYLFEMANSPYSAVVQLSPKSSHTWSVAVARISKIPSAAMAGVAPPETARRAVCAGMVSDGATRTDVLASPPMSSIANPTAATNTFPELCRIDAVRYFDLNIQASAPTFISSVNHRLMDHPHTRRIYFDGLKKKRLSNTTTTGRHQNMCEKIDGLARNHLEPLKTYIPIDAYSLTRLLMYRSPVDHPSSRTGY